MRPKQVLSQWYVWRKVCTYLVSMLALRVLSGASKTISDPMGRLVQTVHLSYSDTNNICKQTETRFHMTHVTYELHCVCPKRLLSLWYVRSKPCTYLVSRLHYLQIDRNKLPLETHHLGVPSGASKRISEPMVRLAPTVHYLAPTLTVSKWTETRFHMTQSLIWCVQNDF